MDSSLGSLGESNLEACTLGVHYTFYRSLDVYK